MTKLTQTEFHNLTVEETQSNEATDAEKKALIQKIYKWQQANNLFAWDVDGLHDDGLTEIHIMNFTVSGPKGVEVEFNQPLDEDIGWEGVAYGYRLKMVDPLQRLYNLSEEPTVTDEGV